MSQDMKQQEPVTDAELDPVLASKVDAYLTLVQDAATDLEKNGLTVQTVSDIVINAAAATTFIVSGDETEKQTPQEDAHDVTDTEAETPEQVTQPFNLKGYKLPDALQVTVLSVTSSQI